MLIVCVNQKLLHSSLQYIIDKPKFTNCLFSVISFLECFESFNLTTLAKVKLNNIPEKYVYCIVKWRLDSIWLKSPTPETKYLANRYYK